MREETSCRLQLGAPEVAVATAPLNTNLPLLVVSMIRASIEIGIRLPSYLLYTDTSGIDPPARLELQVEVNLRASPKCAITCPRIFPRAFLGPRLLEFRLFTC